MKKIGYVKWPHPSGFKYLGNKVLLNCPAICSWYFCFSFDESSLNAMLNDSVKLVAGYFVMFLYTLFALGHLNSVEARPYLAVTGIFAIILGVGAGSGLAFLLGFQYTSMHPVATFLALGKVDQWRCAKNTCEED